MKEFGYYVFLVCVAVCALWMLAVFFRTVLLFLRCRRRYMLSDIGREMLRGGGLRRRILGLVSVSALFGAAAALILLAYRYQNAAVNITLTYTEAASGLNPNGSRYNMSDILSDEVLEEAAGALGSVADPELLKNGLSVEPAQKKKDEDDDDLISTQFALSFVSGRETGIQKAEDIVRTVAETYRNWFIRKYAPDFGSLDLSFEDIDDYDYPDMQQYLSVAVQRIITFSEAFSGKDAAFLSGSTGESFSSLKAKAEDIRNTGLGALNDYILYNGISRDPESYMSRIRYGHLIESNEYLKNIRAYNVRLRAIERYDNDMATVVYIPTYDVDNTFYMSKTKIGIDHFSIDAEAFSAAASGNLETIMSQDYLLRQLEGHRRDSAARRNVGETIETLEAQILELAEKTKQTAQDYLDTAQYGYVSISTPDDSFLKEGICIAAAVLGYLILAYAGMVLARMCRRARPQGVEEKVSGEGREAES